jgi:hypothetical protein
MSLKSQIVDIINPPAKMIVATFLMAPLKGNGVIKKKITAKNMDNK